MDGLEFEEHEVTFYQLMHVGEKRFATEFMEFRIRGCRIGLMQFHVVGRCLFVTGDHGCAVYQWSQPVSLEQIAGFGLNYFAEKCTASEVGIPFQQWDPDRASDFVTDWEVDSGEHSDSFAQAYDDARVNHDDPFESALSWSFFLGDHGQELFGDGYEEYVDEGYAIHLRCRLHHAGLVAAVGQLDRWKRAQVEVVDLVIGPRRFPEPVEKLELRCKVCGDKMPLYGAIPVPNSCPKCICGEDPGITTPFTSDGNQRPILKLNMADLQNSVDFKTATINHVNDQAAVQAAFTVLLFHEGDVRLLKDGN